MTFCKENGVFSYIWCPKVKKGEEKHWLTKFPIVEREAVVPFDGGHHGDSPKLVVF